MTYVLYDNSSRLRYSYYGILQEGKSILLIIFFNILPYTFTICFKKVLILILGFEHCNLPRLRTDPGEDYQCGSKSGTLVFSVVDPDPDPVGSGTFCRIRIRIRNK
jgi:hypothetical protein